MQLLSSNASTTPGWRCNQAAKLTVHVSHRQASVVCKAGRRGEVVETAAAVATQRAHTEATLHLHGSNDRQVLLPLEPAPATSSSFGAGQVMGVLAAAALVGGFLYSRAKRSRCGLWCAKGWIHAHAHVRV